MADMQELERALINADAAGDTEAARQLAGAIMQMRRSTSLAPKIEPPAINDSIGRQAGLFARSAAAGLAGIPQILTEPIRQNITDPLARLLTGNPNLRGAPLSEVAQNAATKIGLPEPRTPTERIVSKGVEMGMGAGGMAGSLSKVNALKMMGVNPGTQALSGAAGGMAGQQSKESGGGALDQFASSLIGGLTAAGAVSAGKGLASKASDFLRPVASPQVVDQRITNILAQQGIDPASIGPAVLSRMRDDVAKAMKVGGGLDENAVARLADYSRLGATPTRAGVTLDPIDVTMQRNAEKLAAATGATDARLPQISQDNNSKLFETLQGMKPNPDAYGAGATAIGNVSAKDAAMTAQKQGLYATAREMAGGDIPVDRGAFTNAAFSELAKQNKLAFLPESVGKVLDQISIGKVAAKGQEFDVPFNVNTIDMLKTMIATESRGTSNGNAKAALKIVRDALDKVDIAPGQTFGGNQVAPLGANVAEDQAASLLKALDAARSSSRSQFAWQESAPGIEAALAKSVPAENFIQRQVISSSAGYDDVKTLAGSLDASGIEAVKGSIAQHLLDAATQKGREASASNFNGPGLSSALKAIGDRKLKLFFSPDEIEAMKSAGRVGGFETFQPRGSAVNNSNTTAAAANLLLSISKRAKLLPGVGPLTTPALDAMALGLQSRPAFNVSRGLLAEPQQRGSFAAGLLSPAIYSGGLLSAD